MVTGGERSPPTNGFPRRWAAAACTLPARRRREPAQRLLDQGGCGDGGAVSVNRAGNLHAQGQARRRLADRCDRAGQMVAAGEARPEQQVVVGNVLAADGDPPLPWLAVLPMG